ncbi:MAG: hypothetical protein WKF67_02890 [Rubrobacteraceae bacterium]
MWSNASSRHQVRQTRFTATRLAATYSDDGTRFARQRVFPYIKRFPGPLEPVVPREPDLNDGVRLNIRPRMQAGVLRARLNIKWNRERRKNPDGSERHNDLHLTRAEKGEARKPANS